MKSSSDGVRGAAEHRTPPCERARAGFRGHANAPLLRLVEQPGHDTLKGLDDAIERIRRREG
jgi:hypothetical protein